MGVQTPSTIFEQRFDALILRLTHLAKLTPGSTVGRELAEVVDEFQRLRRDLSGIDPHDLTPVDIPEGSRQNLIRENTRRYTAKNRPGERRCGRHNDGEGAWLPVEAFDVKNPKTGQLKTWCRECYKEYQRERYVRVGYRVVVVELHEGDPCVGQRCPICTELFQPGQRVRGDHLAHEQCVGGTE